MDLELPPSEPKLLRSACDACHQQKVRCLGGGDSCTRCQKQYVTREPGVVRLVRDADGLDSNLICHYSHIGRRGKPRGSKNKKTLEKERIKALSTDEVSMRRRNSQELQDVVEQNRTLVNGADRYGASVSPSHLAEHPISPNLIEGFLLSSMMNTPDKDRSIQETEIPSEAAILEASMLPDLSLPFALSNCTEVFPSSIDHTRSAHTVSQLSTSSGSETSDQWLTGNMFEFLATPSISDVSSPPRSAHSLIARHTRPIDPGTTAHNIHNTATGVLLEYQDSCCCLQTYAELLCTLRRSEPVEPFGNFMRMMDDAHSTLRANLGCCQCLQDIQVTQLCSMALKNMAGALDSASTVHYSPDIRFGDYILQRDDSTYVGLLLLCRQISKFKSTFEMFKRRVIGGNAPCTSGPQEQEYVDRVVHSIDEAMELLWNNMRINLKGEQ